MAESLLLNSASGLVDRQDGVAHDVKPINDPRCLRGHDGKHCAIGPRHVETAIVKVVFDMVRLAPKPARYLGELPGRKHVDELVIRHITDRC